MSNVVNIKKEVGNRPKDLMPIKDFWTKHRLKYDYLYKMSVLQGKIEPYCIPEWALSECEVLAFMEREKQRKLNKIRIV